MESDQVSVTVHDYDAFGTDSDCDSPSECMAAAQLRKLRRSRMVRLEENEDNYEYKLIKRSLVTGLGLIGKDVHLVAVHKNSYSNPAGRAKLEAFRIFCRATAEKRGCDDANVRYAWYGGGWDEICHIVDYGFGRRGVFEEGEPSHGIGIHLSPANLPIDSALKAKEDENGVRHMLLCRVILGNMETICAGSRQLHPSSVQYDSGIDNPLAPTKYIVWSAYMNSHIFANYIVSFTTNLLTVGTTVFSAKKPRSSSMKFSILLNLLSRFLNPPIMSLVLKYYNDFQENRIDRPQLITRLRSLVGDKILISVIKLFRNEVH